MSANLKNSLKANGLLLLVLTGVLGVIYPLSIAGIGRVLFSQKVNGSLVYNKEQIIGSEIIGQNFSNAGFFWGRPSFGSNPAYPAGASQWSPLNPSFKQKILERAEKLGLTKPNENILSSFPPEILLASASGLDPHISSLGARIQIQRILKARKWDEKKRPIIESLINNNTLPPTLGWLGQVRVNVLTLNRDLENLK